jgi:hypothetical protein
MNEEWAISFGYYQQSTVRVLDAVEAQSMVRRLDMRVAKQFGSRGEVALVAQNVFQNKIIGYSGYSFDRRAYLIATISF